MVKTYFLLPLLLQHQRAHSSQTNIHISLSWLDDDNGRDWNIWQRKATNYQLALFTSQPAYWRSLKIIGFIWNASEAKRWESFHSHVQRWKSKWISLHSSSSLGGTKNWELVFRMDGERGTGNEGFASFEGWPWNMEDHVSHEFLFIQCVPRPFVSAFSRLKGYAPESWGLIALFMPFFTWYTFRDRGPRSIFTNRCGIHRLLELRQALDLDGLAVGNTRTGCSIRDEAVGNVRNNAGSWKIKRHLGMSQGRETGERHRRVIFVWRSSFDVENNRRLFPPIMGAVFGEWGDTFEILDSGSNLVFLMGMIGKQRFCRPETLQGLVNSPGAFTWISHGKLQPFLSLPKNRDSRTLSPRFQGFEISKCATPYFSVPRALWRHFLRFAKWVVLLVDH